MEKAIAVKVDDTKYITDLSNGSGIKAYVCYQYKYFDTGFWADWDVARYGNQPHENWPISAQQWDDTYLESYKLISPMFDRNTAIFMLLALFTGSGICTSSLW